MNDIEVNATFDKSSWGDGPWQTEPDFESFSLKGYECIIIRSTISGALNGYVCIPLPSDNPLTKQPTLFTFDHIDVHGGITFAHEGTFNIDNCTVISGYWLGFDCSHLGDYCPLMVSTMNHIKEMEVVSKGDRKSKKLLLDINEAIDDMRKIMKERYEPTYRDIEYVRSNVKGLVKQIIRVGKHGK